MFGKTKLKTLGPAEAALADYNKTGGVIAQQVAGLPPLIQKRLDAEKELANAKAAQALGEPADVPRAEKRLQGALAVLEDKADLLRGLRSRLLALSGRLAETQQHLNGDLPEHERELKEGFSTKWRKAIGSFEVLLGERQALEGLLGGKLDLPEPSPASFDVAEIARPHEVVKGLQAAVQDIGQMAQVAARSHAPTLTPGASLINYNPDGVYVLRRATRGLTEGTLVLDASFSAGRLESLVETEWAKPWRDPEVQKLAGDARRADL